LNARADTVRLAARREARATKGRPAAATGVNPYRPGTVSWLIRRWAGDISDKNTPGASPEWRRLSEWTRQDYRRHLQAIDELFGRHPLVGLTPRTIHAYKAKLSDPATGLTPRQHRYPRQVHDQRIDDAFVRFEQMERRLDTAESEVEAVDLGRGKTLADEIEELAADSAVEEELRELKSKLGRGQAPSAEA
jgi:hypothetical protein